MKKSNLLITLVCVFAFAGCAGQTLDQSGPPTNRSAKSDSNIVISGAVVEEFIVSSRPRSIVLREAVDGVTQIWFDETSEGEVNTQTYSRDGCPLAGPPIQAGDSIKVVGHLDKDSKIIADTIWILDIEVDSTDCSGPPAS